MSAVKLALFSDVHGNLTALEAVLEEVRRLGPFDRVLCAGDVAVFGPSPAQVIERLEAERVEAVRGNTDDWILQVEAGGGPEADPARTHARWCRDRLGASHLAWLRSLPLQRQVEAGAGRLALVHATPRTCHDEPRLCAPGLPAGTAREVFGPAGAPVVAFGHWHGSFVAWYGDLVLVNVSPVSLTFDGAPAATLAVLEWHGDHWTVQHLRIPYDPAPELERARRHGLPPHPWWEQLAARG